MRNTCINLRDLGIAILATVCVPLVQNCVYMIASALYNNRGVELPTSLLSYVVLILIFGCAYFICPWMYSSSTDHNKKPHKKSAKARKPVLRFFIIFMMCATLEAAKALFSTGAAADMPKTELTEEDLTDGNIDILTMLVKSGLTASKSEARRAVQQGGVSVDGEKVTDVFQTFAGEALSGDGVVLKKGKKNFRKVLVK